MLNILWQTSRCLFIKSITLTSWWAWWRLKSPASRLFTQTFVQAQIKESFASLAFVRRIRTGGGWGWGWGWGGGGGGVTRKCFHLMTSSWLYIWHMRVRVISWIYLLWHHLHVIASDINTSMRNYLFGPTTIYVWTDFISRNRYTTDFPFPWMNI